MTRSRFPVLDTVRGLAFLMVVFAHLGQARGLATTGISQFGVWIFFVLSAFLLSRPFFEAPSRVRNPREIKAYLLRRALRIFPPLAVSVGAFGLVFPGFTWKACVGSFLCMRVYGIFWTVFIEVRYYLLLPLVVATIVALKPKPIALYVVLAAGIMVHVLDCPFWLPSRQWWEMSFAAGPDSSWLSREHLFLQYLPVFVGGTILAAIHVTMAGSLWGFQRMQKLAPIGFILALAGFAALSFAELGLLRWHSNVRYQFQGLWFPLLPLPLALVFSAANLTGALVRFFANPVFRFFGMISYSGYLLHDIFVKQFNPVIANSVLYVCAVLAATVVVATASHYLIERPFMKLAQRPSS